MQTCCYQYDICVFITYISFYIICICYVLHLKLTLNQKEFRYCHGARGRVTHICVSELTIIGSDNRFVAWSAPSHYLNQCWYIVNWTHGNKFQWNVNRKLYIFIQENVFEIVVRELVAILSRPQCVKDALAHHTGKLNFETHLHTKNGLMIKIMDYHPCPCACRCHICSVWITFSAYLASP